MHQSIPAVPTPPPRATVGHLLTLSVPGGRAFAILSRPRGLSISIPQGDPRAFDTRVFERQIYKFIEKDEAFVKDWLVHPGQEKLVDVFKGMFSQF